MIDLLNKIILLEVPSSKGFTIFYNHLIVLQYNSIATSYLILKESYLEKSKNLSKLFNQYSNNLKSCFRFILLILSVLST